MALRYHQRVALVGFLFTLPALLFFAVFSAYPMGNAFFLSLTNYDLVSRQDFVGLRNYLYLFTDPNFRQAALVTARFVLFFAPAVWVLSFLVASLLQGSFRGRNFFRTLFFAPSILSLVGMSVIWRVILNRQGPINALAGLSISWLTERRFALLGIAIMEVWRNLGFFAIMFLVGMQTISQDYYDAAKVDGASSGQILRWVTLPLLRPTFALVFVITIIHAVKIFTPMYIMTEGGPSNATRSVVLLIYRQGLEQLQMGLASAESIVLFVVILILTILQLRVFRVGRED